MKLFENNMSDLGDNLAIEPRALLIVFICIAYTSPPICGMYHLMGVIAFGENSTIPQFNEMLRHVLPRVPTQIVRSSPKGLAENWLFAQVVGGRNGLYHGATNDSLFKAWYSCSY